MPRIDCRKNRIQRKIQRRRTCRIINKIRAMTNNVDTLRRIAQLPIQTTNNQFENQLFNGSSFY